MTELTDRARRDAVSYADRWIGYQWSMRDLPGVVVSVTHRGETLLSRAYGFADRERRIAMTPDHVFRIASHSKTFTATAVMQLVERGALRLDDPIGRYVGWLTGSETAAITLRQLLHHAAGLTRDGSDADYWQLDRPFPDVDELRRLVEDGGQVLPANDTFKYSNIGYSLLGLAIEAAGGMPYAAFVTEHIVRQLGLTDTGPDTDESMRSRLVTGYSRPFLDFPSVPLVDVGTGSMAPATGFYATAADLCRYASAHVLGDNRVLSDASKREMQAPSWEIDFAEERYGLGLAVLDLGTRRLVGHGGSFPGHATRTWLDPHDGLVVVVLINQSNGPARTLATGIVKIIDTALNRADVPVDESHERFAGRFVSSWGVTDVVRLGSALVLLDPEADDPVNEVTELDVVDADTARITKTGGYASKGQTLRYVRDDAGMVRVVNIAGIRSYPEEIYRERLKTPRLD